MLWLSATEIAEAAAAGLMPGLPLTDRGVRRVAERDGWAASGLTRVRDGRSGGGGLEYHVDLLPAPARAAWLGRLMGGAPDDLRPVLTDAAPNPAQDARVVLLRLSERFRQRSGLPATAADALFAEAFNAGSIPLPEWVAQAVSGLSSRTLARWRASDAAPAAIGRPKGSGVLDRADGGAVRTLILAAIARQPFLSAKHVRALVMDRYRNGLSLVDEATGEVTTRPVPSMRMFQIALTAWKSEYRNEIMRLTDPDGYRSKIEFTATGSQRADRLNEVWQIDASPADVMLTGGRHSVYVAIDVYSRRQIILATPTPRASAVGLLIRKAILAWGVPERIHTDNGSDFTAKQTQRLFGALGVEIELSPPYNPKSKGIVERAIGTFQRDLPTCPGFIGHSVADRKVIEGRKAFARRLGASDADLFGVEMDLAAFQAWCDVWADTIYGHDRHAGLGGRTPFAAAASWAGSVRRVENPAALDVLLAPLASGEGTRKVGKQGVRVDGASYLPMGVMPGTDVLVRMDPADMGRIMLFHPETEAFLGEAICAELAGLDPAVVIAKAKAMQKAHETERLTDIRSQMRRMSPTAVARAMQNEGARKASVIAAFPARTETWTTPAIDAAGEAAGAVQRRGAPAPVVDPDRRAAFVAQFDGASRKAAPKENERQRFRRALAFEEQLKRGEQIRPEDELWLRSYQTTAQYRAHLRMFAEFGDQMFG